MTKLRRVVKQTSEVDLPKCCRWCHHYEYGKCYNKNLVEDKADLTIYEVSEGGYLSETIEEVLGSTKLTPFKELEYKLQEWGVSQKRIKEFNSLFKECYDRFAEDLKEELDEKVSMCYVNRINAHDEFEGIVISNPEEFVCKDWC